MVGRGGWVVTAAGVYSGKYVSETGGGVRGEWLMRIVPLKEVIFEFPTRYEDTGPEGDELWNELMPREFLCYVRGERC